MQGRVAMCKGLFGRDWGELVGKEMCFFLWKTGRLLLLCFRVLVPALSSQKPRQDRNIPALCAFPLGASRQARREPQAALVSGPPSPARGMCEENKERVQLAWAAGSLKMVFTPVPLASQMTACCHPSWLHVFWVEAYLSTAA